MRIKTIQENAEAKGLIIMPGSGVYEEVIDSDMKPKTILWCEAQATAKDGTVYFARVQSPNYGTITNCLELAQLEANRLASMR